MYVKSTVNINMSNKNHDEQFNVGPNHGILIGSTHANMR